KFNSYEKYADAQITDIFNDTELKKAKKLTATHQETSLFLSSTDEKFTKVHLPLQAQFSPVSEIIAEDFNQDGDLDLLLLGNNDYYKLR
ncbi:MAG TPA: hypothetical protein DCM40_39510, partial [Maribacter sp.]|nr:hypothetical protein [Maribacter sp.]